MTDQPAVPGRRSYTLGRRRARVEETRERITAAAFELHASIGPSRTTIRSIAERAGVQRHTVYHHFPDLDALYEACTAHGLRVSGVPQPASWLAIAEPGARLRHGLAELHAWYGSNQRMLSAILGDSMVSPPPAGPREPDAFERHMAEIHAALSGAWIVPAATRPLLDAVIAHAVAFETWRSLTVSGLAADPAAELLANIVTAVAEGTLTA